MGRIKFGATPELVPDGRLNQPSLSRPGNVLGLAGIRERFDMSFPP